MASGTALGIGKGIELGVNNFLQSFFAVKNYKAQEKFRKLAPVLAVIQGQINNPNTPLDQKITAIDSIPSLFGAVKPGDIPLSQQLGLDKLSEQMMETGESVVAETGQTKSKTLKAPVNDLQGTQIGEQEVSTPSNKLYGQASKLTRRGTLSDSDLQLTRQRKLKKIENEEEFNKAKQIAILQSELQDKVLSKQGWEKDGDWVLDTNTKQWKRQWTNPRTKESFMQELPPDVVPEAIVKEQMKAGKGGSKDSIVIRSLSAYYESQGNEPEVARSLALQDYQENYKAGTTFKQQGVEGTRKIQPAQEEGINLQKLGAQQKHGELVASAAASETNVKSLETRKAQAWQTAANAFHDFEAVKKDYEPDEKEYQTAAAAYNRANDDANRIETEYQAALKSNQTLTEQVKLSEINLRNSGVETTNSNQTLTPKQKAYVDRYFGGDLNKAIQYNQSKGKTFP